MDTSREWKNAGHIVTTALFSSIGPLPHALDSGTIRRKTRQNEMKIYFGLWSKAWLSLQLAFIQKMLINKQAKVVYWMNCFLLSSNKLRTSMRSLKEFLTYQFVFFTTYSLCMSLTSHTTALNKSTLKYWKTQISSFCIPGKLRPKPKNKSANSKQSIIFQSYAWFEIAKNSTVWRV